MITPEIGPLMLKDFPNDELLCIGHNGRFITMHDPTRDMFLKVDRNPQGNWLRRESELIKASVKFVHPEITDEKLAEDINLFHINSYNDQTTLGLQTPRLGINIQDAFRKGMVTIEDIPFLYSQLLNTSETLFLSTGIFNKDLNPKNVLLDESTNGLVIIDWFKHSSQYGFGELSAVTIASSVAKFIKPFLREGLIKDTLFDNVVSKKHLDVLGILEERNLFL